MALFAGWLCNDNAASTTVVETNGSYDGTFYDAGGNPNTDAHNTTIGGKAGLIFDGTNDYIRAGATSSFAWMHGKGDTAAFAWSVSFWYKTNAPEPNARYHIIGDGRLATSDTGFNISFDDDSHTRAIRIMINEGTVVSVLDGYIEEGYPNDAGWHQVVVTYDQALVTANSKVYVDSIFKGSIDKTNRPPDNNNSSYNLYIGESLGTGDLFDGNLSDISIYNTVLTQTEITALYKASVPNPSRGTVRVGCGSVGTRFVATRYPVTEGLIAGTTKQTGSPIIDPRDKDG